MPLVKGSDHRAFPFDTFRIVALVSPTTGSKETCAWHVSMAPGNPGQAHWVDHEQLFVVLAGSATAHLGAEEHVLEAGDALIVPAGETFSIANPNDDSFETLCIMPAGAVAHIPGQEPTVLPWAR